ncbi:unnamed protein product [Polarella glacialis]|uniref:Prolyl aminopeptidase n=1 Tax=Polarella glacialis TaxID=89957 RepID=A0A813HZ00_POLGL|nr:unnamed protein product [Polarella glacialis]CAE8642717.1 unnamed protein product [Polarella glacialis]
MGLWRPSIHCLAAASLLFGGTDAVLRQELLAQRRSQQSEVLKADPPTPYPEQFYSEQILDHFNKSDGRRYAQRYFTNFDHYKPGGPIILNIGGEGPLDEGSVSGHLSNVLFAKELGGAAVAVEHRFYGKSQPFDSLATEHLSYLASRQALADLAGFQEWFVAKHSLQGSQWFCLGGSYPGSLASWYRLEYPEKTSGCWSASGPVHAKEVWPGFGEKVWEAMSTSVDGVRDETVAMKLYAGYEQVAGLIQDSTPEAFEQLESVFNVCPGTLVSQQDRDNFENTVSSYVGLVMQYNNTRVPRLADIRRIVIEATTPLDAALKVSQFVNLTVGDGPGKCVGNSISSFYKQLLDATLPQDGSGNAGRAWTWQTCFEPGSLAAGLRGRFRPERSYCERQHRRHQCSVRQHGPSRHFPSLLQPWRARWLEPSWNHLLSGQHSRGLRSSSTPGLSLCRPISSDGGGSARSHSRERSGLGALQAVALTLPRSGDAVCVRGCMATKQLSIRVRSLCLHACVSSSYDFAVFWLLVLASCGISIGRIVLAYCLSLIVNRRPNSWPRDVSRPQLCV